MIQRARERPLERRLKNVEFDGADVQVRAFTNSLDVAISRFGVMFLDDPVAAFSNVASALRSSRGSLR